MIQIINRALGNGYFRAAQCTFDIWDYVTKCIIV